MKAFPISCILSTVVLCCVTSFSSAQSSGELKMLRSINPRYPINAGYKALSGTTTPLAVAIPFGMLAWSLIDDNKKLESSAYEVAASLAITALATGAMKTLIKRPRPYYKYNDIYPDSYENSYAFPSGHTSTAFAIATSLTLTSKKWYLAVPAFAWASGVGYSRLYLGQHYPSDVAVGAIVGAAGAYASHWLNKKFFTKKKNSSSIVLPPK